MDFQASDDLQGLLHWCWSIGQFRTGRNHPGGSLIVNGGAMAYTLAENSWANFPV